MKVKSLMSPNVTSCRANTSMAEAAQQMWDRDCGVLPVTDDDGRLVGVVTDRDICMSAASKNEMMGSLPVETAMTRETVTVGPEDEADTLHRKMRDHRVRRLPVLDDDHHVVGMVSLNDLGLAADREPANAVARRQEVATTLAHICEHGHDVAGA